MTSVYPYFAKSFAVAFLAKMVDDKENAKAPYCAKEDFWRREAGLCAYPKIAKLKQCPVDIPIFFRIT